MAGETATRPPIHSLSGWAWMLAFALVIAAGIALPSFVLFELLHPDSVHGFSAGVIWTLFVLNPLATRLASRWFDG